MTNYKQKTKNSTKYKTKVQELQTKHDKLLYQIISLERLNKNYLVAITKLENLNFMDRIRNRIPKDINALTDGIGNNEHKNISIPDNKREW